MESESVYLPVPRLALAKTFFKIGSAIWQDDQNYDIKYYCLWVIQFKILSKSFLITYWKQWIDFKKYTSNNSLISSSTNG